jgi:chaperonin GroEL (HSP60 family)
MNRCISDMETLNVWESLVSKEAQLLMATEAAISILKIDEIIQLETVNL